MDTVLAWETLGGKECSLKFCQDLNVWVLHVVTFLMFVLLIFQWTVRPFTSLSLVLADLIRQDINLQNLFVMNY